MRWQFRCVCARPSLVQSFFLSFCLSLSAPFQASGRSSCIRVVSFFQEGNADIHHGPHEVSHAYRYEQRRAAQAGGRDPTTATHSRSHPPTQTEGGILPTGEELAYHSTAGELHFCGAGNLGWQVGMRSSKAVERACEHCKEEGTQARGCQFQS